jgi:hypothetical protein
MKRTQEGGKGKRKRETDKQKKNKQASKGKESIQGGGLEGLEEVGSKGISRSKNL